MNKLLSLLFSSQGLAKLPVYLLLSGKIAAERYQVS